MGRNDAGVVHKNLQNHASSRTSGEGGEMFDVDFDIETNLQNQWIMQLQRILRRKDVDFSVAGSVFQYQIRPYIFELNENSRTLDISEKHKNDEKLMYEFIGRYIAETTF